MSRSPVTTMCTWIGLELLLSAPDRGGDPGAGAYDFLVEQLVTRRDTGVLPPLTADELAQLPDDRRAILIATARAACRVLPGSADAKRRELRAELVEGMAMLPADKRELCILVGRLWADAVSWIPNEAELQLCEDLVDSALRRRAERAKAGAS